MFCFPTRICFWKLSPCNHSAGPCARRTYHLPSFPVHLHRWCPGCQPALHHPIARLRDLCPSKRIQQIFHLMNIYRYHSLSPGPARFLVIIVAFLNQHLRPCSCWWQMLPSFRITQEPHGFATHWCFLQRTRQAVFPTPFGSMLHTKHHRLLRGISRASNVPRR